MSPHVLKLSAWQGQRKETARHLRELPPCEKPDLDPLLCVKL